MFTSRERVLTALNHQEPDRIPVDFGGTGISSASEKVIRQLKDYLGLKGEGDPRFHYFDERIQRMFDVDLRRISHKPSRKYKPRINPDGSETDEWGLQSKPQDKETLYVSAPLAKATIEDIETYPWPQPHDPSRFEGLEKEAKTLYYETDYCIVADPVGCGLFEMGCQMRGYDRFLEDMVINQEFVHAFFAKYLSIISILAEQYYEAVGKYIHIAWVGDDMAMQTSPFFSPQMYGELVKPYFKQYLKVIKERTKAKIMLHCCGSVYSLINEFIDTGIEILNPIQPAADNMEPWRLKQGFGDRLSFHGGIDLQYVLPKGSVTEVKEHVKERIEALSPGGGYILAPAHSLPDDVPPQNIVAMLEAANEYGRYNR